MELDNEGPYSSDSNGKRGRKEEGTRCTVGCLIEAKNVNLIRTADSLRGARTVIIPGMDSSNVPS